MVSSDGSEPSSVSTPDDEGSEHSAAASATATPSSKKATKPRKRRGRWFRNLVRLAFVLPFAVVALAQTEYARSKASAAAVRAIHDELKLNATIDDVRIGLLPPAILIGRTTLTHPTGGRLLTAEHAIIRPSIWAALRGKLDISGITVQHADARIAIANGVILNFPEVRTTEGGKTEIPFRRLLIEDSRVRVEMRNGEVSSRAEIADVNVEVAVSRSLVVDVEARMARGTFAHARGSETLESLEVEGRLDAKMLSIKRLALRSSLGSVHVQRATIPMPFAQRGEGALTVDIDAGHVRALATNLGFTDVVLPPMSGRLGATWTGKYDPSAGPTGAATIAVRGLTVEQFSLNEIDVRGSVADHVVTVDRGDIRIIDGGGTASFHGNVKLEPTFPMTLRIDVQDVMFTRLIQQLGVNPHPSVEWIFERSEISLVGTLDPPNLEGPIRAETRGFLVTKDGFRVTPARRIVGVPRAKIRATVSVREDGLRFERIVGELPNTRVTGDLLLGFKGQLHTSVRSEHVDIRDASPLLNFPISGVGTTTVEVHGTYHEQEVRGHTSIADFTFDGKRVGAIETDWHLEEDNLVMRAPMVHANRGDSRFDIRDLTLDFRDSAFAMTGNLETDAFHLRDFYYALGYETDERFTSYQATVGGAAEIQYTLGRRGDGPDGTLLVNAATSIRTANLDGYEFDGGRLSGRWKWLRWPDGYRGGELTITEATLTKAGATLSLDGAMHLGGKLDMTAVIEGLPLEATEGIRERLPTLRGTSQFSARIEGSLAVPRVRGELQLNAVRLGTLPIGDARFVVNLLERNDPWILASTEPASGSPPLAAGVNQRPRTSARADRSAGCFQARRAIATTPWDADPPLHTREGLLPALDRPMAYVVCGSALNGRFRVDLGIGRTSKKPLRGRVQFGGVLLHEFFPRFAMAYVRGLEARASGSLDFLNGNAFEPETLDIDARLSELSLETGEARIANDGETILSLRRGQLMFERGRFVAPGSFIELSGTARVANLDVGMRGELSLGIAPRFLSSIERSPGRAEFDVRIGGTLLSPQITGAFHAGITELALVGSTVSIRDVALRARFEGERVFVTEASAHLGSGTIAADGELVLDSLSPHSATLRIRAQDITPPTPVGLDVLLDADTVLSWQRGPGLPRLTGDIEVQRFTYSRPLHLGQNFTLGRLTRSQLTEVESYDPRADRIAFDLRVRSRTPFRVQNNLIDGEIRIEDSERAFRIVGTDQRYGAVGTLVVPRGVLRFRTTDFDVTRGTLEFDDPTRFNPRFELRATTQFRRGADISLPSWRFGLYARGSRDEFRLDMTSEPDLSQEDILLLLTIGLTRAEAEQLSADAAAQTAAIEALSTLTGADRELRRLLPMFDDARVTSGYSVRTARMEPRLTVGKRLADRVWLSATSNIGESREFRSNLEWRLNDQVSVQTGYDNLNTTTSSGVGNLGADLRWHLDFE